MSCAYCGGRDVHDDHVLAASLVENYNRDHRLFDKPPIPDEWLGTVRSCFDCNITKYTYRLLPPSWEHLIGPISEFFGGVRWRVYTGGPVP